MIRLPSVRVARSHHFQDRPDQNHEIKSQAPVVDVPKVKIKTVFHKRDLSGSATRAVDLRPTGYSRLDVMPECIFRQQLTIVAVVSDGMRTGADKGHVADQDIEKLRQLIDAGGADQAAKVAD